jgi:hypothetical protein
VAQSSGSQSFDLRCDTVGRRNLTAGANVGGGLLGPLAGVLCG